jgi:hypothetical protein
MGCCFLSSFCGWGFGLGRRLFFPWWATALTTFLKSRNRLVRYSGSVLNSILENVLESTRGAGLGLVRVALVNSLEVSDIEVGDK